MTTSVLNTKLPLTAPPAAVVVVRAVVVVGNAPQGLEQHTIPKLRRRKPDGVFRLSSSRKVGPEEKDWSMASSGTISTYRCFTGVEFIVHSLEQQSIKTMTGIPGGSILPVYDALSQSTQIRHILTRHEQGMGFIARGITRTDGRPAVCTARSGPGTTDPVTAIVDMRLDSIPLICITSQIPASMIGTDAFQEVDICGISTPITRHNYLVRHTEGFPQVISNAFRIA